MASQVQQHRHFAEVVSLDSRTAARFVHTVYQEEMAEIVDRRARLRQEKRELDELQQKVATAIRCGARIEPGLYSAEILTTTKSGYNVPPCSFTRLIIR